MRNHRVMVHSALACGWVSTLVRWSVPNQVYLDFPGVAAAFFVFLLLRLGVALLSLLGAVDFFACASGVGVAAAVVVVVAAVFFVVFAFVVVVVVDVAVAVVGTTCSKICLNSSLIVASRWSYCVATQPNQTKPNQTKPNQSNPIQSTRAHWPNHDGGPIGATNVHLQRTYPKFAPLAALVLLANKLVDYYRCLAHPVP
jgi:hypothetical protein